MCRDLHGCIGIYRDVLLSLASFRDVYGCTDL